MVRLFGNIMSHQFMIAIIVSLAGLLLPVPFMLLGLMIGIIQAYIFMVLAAVYIGAAVSYSEAEGGKVDEH
jgi:F-type H+-transporting ATPase subunit a